jgi:SAM-dependent methyltransferase
MYYTPDWLAEHLVNLVLTIPTPHDLRPETRVVDPACGSGTFLVEIVNRQVAAAPVDDQERTLDLILRNVVGFDISPRCPGSEGKLPIGPRAALKGDVSTHAAARGYSDLHSRFGISTKTWWAPRRRRVCL